MRLYILVVVTPAKVKVIFSVHYTLSYLQTAHILYDVSCTMGTKNFTHYI